MKCNYCPRKCGVDRTCLCGFCGEEENIRIAKVIDNFMWEEPDIVRDNGTCAIFFSGCNLKCSFCQNYKISRGGVGKVYTTEEFVELLKKIDKSNNETIDLITPTHFYKQIISAFKNYKPKKKVIWNSSGYETEEEIEQISEYVDIFLPDFKYSDNNLAQKLSKAKDYFEVAGKAIKKMSELKPNVYNNGRLESGVIIRHLVLPGEVENSLGVLEFIKQNIKDPIVSLMAQFVPSGEGQIGRILKPIEYKIVLNRAKSLGLEKGYIQELSASDKNFIPDF